MKQTLKEASYKLFFALDGMGVHLLPKHFYTPLPDYRWLKANPQLWTGRASLKGIDWNIAAQAGWLAEICTPFYQEVAGLRRFEEITSRRVGPGYGPIESQVLHCFMRAKAPKQVIEIGSGVSTACMLEAIQANEQNGRYTDVTCIEPFPKEAFRTIKNIEHLRQPLQAVPLSLFEKLQPGDFLFIDSSHAVKTGSEVLRIFLDIVPALPAGVFIHVHDINLPFEYPRDALEAYYASQETALLLALLTDNTRLSILASLSGLHYECPDRMRAILSDYRPQANHEGMPAPDAGRRFPNGHFPSSTWLLTH